MPRFVAKCPKCEHQESIISTSMSAEMPPCPRCEAFVRMADITPVGTQTKVISTAGSQTTEESGAPAPAPAAEPAPVFKKRDPRDFGPEPRA